MEQGRLCRISHLRFPPNALLWVELWEGKLAKPDTATSPQQPQKSRLLLKILLEINRDDFDEQISLVSHDLVTICVSCVRCGLFVVLVLVVDREGELVTYRTPGPAPWSAPGPALAARPGPAHHSHSVISCRSWPSTEKLIVRLRYALQINSRIIWEFSEPQC